MPGPSAIEPDAKCIIGKKIDVLRAGAPILQLSAKWGVDHRRIRSARRGAKLGYADAASIVRATQCDWDWFTNDSDVRMEFVPAKTHAKDGGGYDPSMVFREEESDFTKTARRESHADFGQLLALLAEAHGRNIVDLEKIALWRLFLRRCVEFWQAHQGPLTKNSILAFSEHFRKAMP